MKEATKMRWLRRCALALALGALVLAGCGGSSGGSSSTAKRRRTASAAQRSEGSGPKAPAPKAERRPGRR